ncbi:hypothetical protein [Parendozoicomonas sp. Alg238-R29]|uniref:hypothetical protein n=1 Tax=Parendozoicomonas sp. Alg238-R29 TaxID=2993446 RepID=UPI00248D3E2F|nr:hypothetical protein [Parendozoicomonas sp. Alg238-R29]
MKALWKPVTAFLTVLFSISTLSVKAGHLSYFEGDVVIVNNTPFTLQYKKFIPVIHKKDQVEMGEFSTNPDFDNQNHLVPANETITIGRGASLKKKSEGRLRFNFVSTDRDFDLHYRFGKNEDDNTWVSIKGVDSDDNYPFAEIQVTRNCIEGTFRNIRRYKCTATLTMVEEQTACFYDKSCTPEPTESIETSTSKWDGIWYQQQEDDWDKAAERYRLARKKDGWLL